MFNEFFWGGKSNMAPEKVSSFAGKKKTLWNFININLDSLCYIPYQNFKQSDIRNNVAVHSSTIKL